MYKHFLIACLAITFPLFIVNLDTALAEELEIVNRPVNTSGLTGLLFTTSPFTIAPGTTEFGAAVLSENSVIPPYTITESSLSVTYGIARAMELSLKGSSFQKKSDSADVERGPGDVELSYKWNFMPGMPSDDNGGYPALGMIVAGIVPSPDNRDKDFDQVRDWGMHVGLTAGAELSWGEHSMGLYADAQYAFQDLSNKLYRDSYNIINAGCLLPISKQRNLQIFVEYSKVTGRKPINGYNNSAITSGLRLVSEKFNISIGTQYVHKELEGYDNSSRVIGMVSVKL